jgi:glutamine---fructose-6-phosphate transaminase (isomerizing)
MDMTSPSNTIPGAHSHAEILSQADSWRGAVETINASQSRIRALFAANNGPVVFVGCGSPYYLELTAAAVYRKLTGSWAIALPASEVLMNLDYALPGSSTPLVVAVSRSGETSELVAACRLLKEQRGSKVLLITVSTGTTLERLADETVFIPNAVEISVAQTRSFSAMLLTTLGAIAVGTGNLALWHELQTLPARAKPLLDRIAQPIADLIGRGFERLFFLGSGLRHGLAHEGSLKMKEMSLTNSEPFHFLEFRHGPMSMVDSKTLIVGLVSEHAANAEVKVLREMLEVDGTVIAIGPTVGESADPRFVTVPIEAGLSEIAQLPLYMPVLHLLAYNQSIRKGLDCDNPRNLHAWIKLPEVQ